MLIFRKKQNQLTMIVWLLVGLAAGAIAKMITPQDEKGGWISSLIIGLVGSVVGGLIFDLLGITIFNNLVGDIITAVLGALLVLFVYYKYLKDKWNLPI